MQTSPGLERKLTHQFKLHPKQFESPISLHSPPILPPTPSPSSSSHNSHPAGRARRRKKMKPSRLERRRCRRRRVGWQRRWMGWGGAGRERAPSWGGLPSRGGRPATGKSIDSGGITSGRRREAAGRERTQEPSGQQLEPRELRGRDRTQGLYGQQLEPRELRGRDRTQEPSGQQLEPRELRSRPNTGAARVTVGIGREESWAGNRSIRNTRNHVRSSKTEESSALTIE